MRWKNGKTPEERFWNQVDKSGECWIWKGYKHKSGYGYVTINSVPTRTHIVAWMWVNKEKPKKDFHVHHVCSNKSCVNPDHLELLHKKEHWEKTLLSIKEKKQSRKYCKKNHLLTDSNSYIYTNPNTGYSTRRCKECQHMRNQNRNRKKTIN